jgi:tetratricopeptide (TPR) repeat protein
MTAQNKGDNKIFETLNQLREELGFTSFDQLWMAANQDKANWNKRLNGQKPISKKVLDKLIKGLGNALTQEQKDSLYTAIGKELVIVPVKPERQAKLDELKDPDRLRLLDSRLKSFVPGTRQEELKAVLKLVEAQKAEGGYVAITGKAGEGKTALVAHLIEHHFGREKIPYHFIPFNPGPEHQVALLRSLMAILALKYTFLSDLWADVTHPNALAGSFIRMLDELSERKIREVIFIDGLDQILPDSSSAKRDLTFLPEQLPPGIVVVLSTRPDDVLQPLALKSPYQPYPLPELSENDFQLILRYRGVSGLSRAEITKLYLALNKNALYLGLVTSELLQAEHLQPEALIARLADNPAEIFGLPMERLKLWTAGWERVVLRVLGLLLATVETRPLKSSQLHQLLGGPAALPYYLLRDGLERLRSLVECTEQDDYYLYHLGLIEYLKPIDPATEAGQIIKKKPKADYFSEWELECYHRRLAEWCEEGHGGLAVIWQNIEDDKVAQFRREYVRQHYITHLYRAKEYTKLFEVLNEGNYGRGKLSHDLSTRSYAQDLDLGREAATLENWSFEEGLSLLPELWRYSLLRCSLASRADNYPAEWYEGMVLVGCQQEAIGLAELLTNPEKKAYVIGGIGWAMWKDGDVGQKQEAWVLLGRALEVAHQIEDDFFRDQALNWVAEALARADEGEQTSQLLEELRELDYQEGVVLPIDLNVKAADTLVMAGDYEAAQELARSIKDCDCRARALSVVAKMLARVDEVERANQLLKEAQEIADQVGEQSNDSREKALKGIAQVQAEAGKYEAVQEITDQIEDISIRQEALIGVAVALTRAGKHEAAQEIADQIEDYYSREKALKGMAQVQARAGNYKEALEMARTIKDSVIRVEALSYVAHILAKSGEIKRSLCLLKEAKDLAIQILDVSIRARALSVVVETMARADEFEISLELVCQIEDNCWKVEALVGIATALAIAGKYEVAQEITDQVEDSVSRVKALSYVAHILAKADKIERSNSLLREAQEIADQIEDSYSKEKALIVVAKVLAETGKRERAQKIAQHIEDSYGRADILIVVTQTLAMVGDYEETQEIARTIEVWKVLLWERIAQALVTDEKALRWVQQVWKQANTREHTLEILPLAYPFIPLKPEIGWQFYEALAWVDGFLKET